jgi:hypothetical protein
VRRRKRPLDRGGLYYALLPILVGSLPPPLRCKPISANQRLWLAAHLNSSPTSPRAGLFFCHTASLRALSGATPADSNHQSPRHDCSFVHLRVMLHLFDDAGRPIHVSLLLLGLASTGEVNEVCKQCQVVLQWLKRPNAFAGCFRGTHGYPLLRSRSSPGSMSWPPLSLC